MTKSQIWVASFLVLFLILFGLSQLTQNHKQNNIESNDMVNSIANDANEQTALGLIKSNGCTSCHGAELTGTNLGPNLIGVKQYWTNREALINYLRNPSSFMDKDRFVAYKERFSSVVMPSFNNLDVKDLGKIADYLRGL